MHMHTSIDHVCTSDSGNKAEERMERLIRAKDQRVYCEIEFPNNVKF